MPVENRNLRSSYPRFWVHGKHEGVVINGKQKLKLPPLEVLNWLFRYCPITGKLYKIRRAGGRLYEKGREVTTVNSYGYLMVGITDSNATIKSFMVHHICFYMHNEIEPLSVVDHINGIPTDNRFSNFRLVNQSLNCRNRGMMSNNTSGHTGVTWDKSKEKWKAYARDNTGKSKHLGLFDEKEEAARVVSAYYANPENGYSERHGLNASISNALSL